MNFHRYHALGNDYLVLDPKEWDELPSPDRIRIICHRHFGVGSDGILWGPLPSERAEFGLRIFNPDGSEAEKSGNGLRIFSRYLWDIQAVRESSFSIETPGGLVRSEVGQGGRQATVDMGRVSFLSSAVPVNGPEREVLQEPISVEDRSFTFTAAGIGNPHCIIPLPEISPDLARRYGPHLETHPYFPNRTNVQFLQVLDRQNIRIEIWERGAGYTLASGSSSSASAAAAHRLGLCDRSVTVHMPGGTLAIEIGEDFSIRMTGGVTRVAGGVMTAEMLGQTLPV